MAMIEIEFFTIFGEGYSQLLRITVYTDNNERKRTMKKKFFLTAAIAALLMTTTPAFAEDHESGEGHRGKMLEKIDTDGNGEISKDEFIDAHTKHFEEADTDGSGSLSRDEMKAMLEKRKEKRSEWREKMKEKRDQAKSE